MCHSIKTSFLLLRHKRTAVLVIAESTCIYAENGNHNSSHALFFLCSVLPKNIEGSTCGTKPWRPKNWKMNTVQNEKGALTMRIIVACLPWFPVSHFFEVVYSWFSRAWKLTIFRKLGMTIHCYCCHWYFLHFFLLVRDCTKYLSTHQLQDGMFYIIILVKFAILNKNSNTLNCVTRWKICDA